MHSYIFLLPLSSHILKYIFLAGIIGSTSALVGKGNSSIKDVVCIKKKKDMLFLFVLTVVFTLGLYSNFGALHFGGDVAIVYKIISYSLIIPIILSIIFYKEKVIKKKAIAFALTIVSILLLI